MQRWHSKNELKGVVFNCTSNLLNLDILANDCIKGLWYYTLDERAECPNYFGPFRSKEQADRAASSKENREHWKVRLWYL
jgi:hypothetical protein